MNTFPKKTNGWILCPSKSFPGKYYYFNATTGEAAWSLNESESSPKNAPLQAVDHCYPEPHCPPVDETSIPNQQTIQCNPYNGSTMSNSQDMISQNTPNSFGYGIQPYEHIPKPMPYQIQVPMIWPSDGNMPQVVMIVMNQAMRQMSLYGPNQHFIQPNRAIQPNKTWKEPNCAWVRPNELPKETKELDRELFVHSGKVLLSERFINYKKPEFEQQKIVNPKQDGLLQNNSCIQALTANHSGDSPGPVKLNHNIENEQNISVPEPILNLGNEKAHSNAPFNFTKKSPEKNESNANVSQSPSTSVKSSIKHPNSGRILSNRNQGPFGQYQTNERLFGQSETNNKLIGNSQTNVQLFGKNQANKKLFGQNANKFGLSRQSLTNQKLFGQNHTNRDNFEQNQTGLIWQNQTKQNNYWQLQTNQEVFHQSPTNIDCFRQKQTTYVFGQNQSNKKNFGPKQQLFRPLQTSPDSFQSFDLSLESNPLQKLITEKTLKPKDKVDSYINKTSYPEDLNETNAMEKSSFTPHDEAEISQEINLQNLDETDLRRILEKKRKFNIVGATDVIAAKKIKTNLKEYGNIAAPTKKVTFNLEPECFSASENGENYEDTECKEESPDESWYVVTDAHTLLEDFDDLDSFVKSDPKCTLMVPSGVMSDIVALSRGECRERSLVTLARHLLRALATPRPHIVVQESKDTSLGISTDDSILNSCVEVMDNAYVVLVTNDDNLRVSAEYLNINCFTSDHIKNSQAKQPEVNFDMKKVANEDMQIPTNKFAMLSISAEIFTHQKRSSPNSDKQTRHVDSENKFRKMSPGFQTGTTENDDETIFSNFKRANNTVSEKGSIFNIVGIAKSQPQKQMNSSIFNQIEEQSKGSYFKMNCPSSKRMQPIYENSEAQFQPSVFGTETHENSVTQSKVFGKKQIPNEEKSTFLNIKTYRNGENQTESNKPNGKPVGTQKRPSVFPTKTRDNQPKPDTETVINIKNKSLEQFLNRFYEKYKVNENIIEQRKDEVECCFKQVMEDCLNNILQNNTDIKSPPPWTLSEALQCMAVAYSNHSYIRDVVSVITSVLNAKGDVSARNILRNLGCGEALVKYLIFITPTSEMLKETEEALTSILRNLNADIDLEPRVASYSPTEVPTPTEKRFFIKDRSEVIKYLKKHFAAWAEYDETLEENTSNVTWGKNYQNTTILRTYGKHLSSLKLNNSKPMTMEPDSSQHINGNTKTSEQENVQQNVHIQNKTDTETMDIKTILLNKSFTKDNVDLKLTKTIKYTSAKELKNHDQKLIDQNEKSESKHTEPKVIRLFSNIDFTKENTNKKVSDRPVFDDFSVHGHTFGTEQNGPKIFRNIKLIDEFEKKLNDLDVADSDKFKYDDNNNLASESTNNYCLSMSIEHNDDFQQKRYLDAINDRSLEKNYGLDATNDNLNSNHNSIATNNESHSMSLEKCITNNTYGTIDLDEILPIDKSTIEMFDFNIDTGTNDYEIDAVNDYERLNYESYEINDVINDIVLKDDETNDSGFENASQLAYCVMDTFLHELKVAFEGMHKFLGNSVREVRSGPVSMSTSQIIRDTIAMTRPDLSKIMQNLVGILQRETSGPKLKELVAGAGSVAASDERILKYREILTKCYKHALLIDNALSAMLIITNEQRR